MYVIALIHSWHLALQLMLIITSAGYCSMAGFILLGFFLPLFTVDYEAARILGV